jgi:hypothetical protein
MYVFPAMDSDSNEIFNLFARSPICDNNSVRAVKQNPFSSRVGKLLVNFLKIRGVEYHVFAASHGGRSTTLSKAKGGGD